MGLFKSVATKAVVTVARSLGLTSPGLLYSVGGQPSSAGKMVTVDAALQLDTVWACVRLISQTVATLPLMVYRRDGEGRNDLAGDHPLYKVLHDQPNADMTATEFWEAIVSNVLLWGNAYAEISRGVTGQVVALTPMRSDRVILRRQPDGSLLYVYSWMGQILELQDADVFHVKGFSLDGRIGMSAVAYGRQTLGSAIAAEEAAAKIFANGMRPSGYMSSPQILTPAQREKTKELLGQFKGSENTGKVPLLEGGWKFEPLSLPPEDGQLLESRSFHVEQICRWFDVPPIMIGHMEKSTAWGSGMEQMMLWFLTFSLRPHLERIEQAIKRDLVVATDPHISAEFKVEGLLRADSATRSRLYSSLVQNGIRTRNEIRGLENLPGLPGGDDLTVQTNLIPIQDLGKIATMPKDKPVEPGEAVQSNPDPGGAAPNGGGQKSQIPFLPGEVKASDFTFVWDRPTEEETKAFNPSQLRDVLGRFGSGSKIHVVSTTNTGRLKTKIHGIHADAGEAEAHRNAEVAKTYDRAAKRGGFGSGDDEDAERHLPKTSAEAGPTRAAEILVDRDVPAARHDTVEMTRSHPDKPVTAVHLVSEPQDDNTVALHGAHDDHAAATAHAEKLSRAFWKGQGYQRADVDLDMAEAAEAEAKWNAAGKGFEARTHETKGLVPYTVKQREGEGFGQALKRQQAELDDFYEQHFPLDGPARYPGLEAANNHIGRSEIYDHDGNVIKRSGAFIVSSHRVVSTQ